MLRRLAVGGVPEVQRRRKGKTRVVFVTNTPVYGGTEKHLIDLLTRVDRTRTDAIVLCVKRDVFSEAMKTREGLRVLVKKLPEPRGFFGYWAMFARLRPHVIVFVNGQLGLFPWQAYAAGRLWIRRKVVGIEHLIADQAPHREEGRGGLEWLRRTLGWRARHMARIAIAGTLSTKTICVSKAVRDRLVQEYGYPDARTVAIVNGVDVEHYRRGGKQTSEIRKTLGIAPDEFVILAVASLVPQKRIDLLLEAIAHLTAEGVRCTCIILGEGPLRARLTKQAAELGVSSTVFFIGFVLDIRPYLAACDLFVLASDKEGLPLALLEAMAYEVPCIVTNVGGNGEVLAHGEDGLLVEPGSRGALAEAIQYALNNSGAMRRMARNGAERVRRDFRVEETMKLLEAALLG
jgi:glycosyltransferase involved in cell wall biosynthesis